MNQTILYFVQVKASDNATQVEVIEAGLTNEID